MMQIKIKPNATSLYTSDRFHASFPNKSTIKMLESLEGKTVEVDTAWLYPNQFKLMNGEKIDENYVEQVINDVRHQYKRCGDCGHSVPKEEMRCDLCECEDFSSLEKKQPLLQTARRIANEIFRLRKSHA